MSPKLALTPAQKKQAPLQWLSEGHARRLEDLDIPSLDEVRKTLVFNMEEAETISQTGSDGVCKHCTTLLYCKQDCVCT